MRILRLIIEEALGQGEEPTQEEDLVKALEAQGYLVPTRGRQRGIRRRQSHKVIQMMADDITDL